MINIRQNVFETNSSSTHSIVIMSKEEGEKVKKGELFINLAAHGYENEEIPDYMEFTRYPELVPESVLLAEAKKHYLKEEKYQPDCHNDFHDGHHVSWEEIMQRCNGDYRGYDLNIFSGAGETYINPTSKVGEGQEIQELPDGKVKVEFDHFFG